ncbi:MAG TPA: VWA domain-containing protein [Bdellovibrionales bacterium]|nr:VWA domain-containing protein [Bdellovibrionales bacterium]
MNTVTAFAWASWEMFFWLIPVAAVTAWLLLKRGRRASLQFSTVKLFKGLPRGFRARLTPVPNVLKVAALVLAVVALARPQESSTKVKKNVEGIDIMFAMDISDSMLIEDMEPENRYGAARKTIVDFIKGRVSDRMGLVLFSAEAYTRVPPTLDYKVLLDATNDIQVTRKLKMGTAIGVGLATAVARLKESTAKSRVVILLTDGENNSGTIAPETALEIAKGYGIRVYTIGVGRDGPTQLPIFTTDPFGKQIKTYQPFYSKVNEELLEKLATETGGKYFRATRTKDLSEVYREIDRLEKTKVDINRYTRYAELFQNYLKWAVLLYLLGFGAARTVLRGVP